MRVAVKFGYDGRLFHGFARQPNLKTVEGELINSLTNLGIIEDATGSCFRSASRTDKGVSALGNVVAFNTNESIDCILSDLSNDLVDIFPYGIAMVESDFYPRYAKLRHYRYYLRFDGLDVEKIMSVASVFTGEHNFSNFARIEEFKNPVRCIDNIVITVYSGFLMVDFFAQTFLWNQIRRIVSVFEKIGSGNLAEGGVVNALNNPNVRVDFGLAPAEPLILKDVVYGFDFEIDKKMIGAIGSFEENLFSYFVDI